MKTAAFILNHNLPDYTDMLYESLKPYERTDYDLFVIDNGSSKEGKSKHTSLELEENVYFGGGFNAAMQYTLENKEYDSMMFLNNDLTVHPYNFVKALREEMLSGYDIVSPSFYNVEPDQQCHWRGMRTHHEKEIRRVPFSDFQCPLISRRLLEEVKEIHQSLIMGWGVDFFFALIARDNGWKIGVVDRCCIIHHNSLTVKRGVSGLDISTYCKLAEEGQREFFYNIIKRQHEYIKLRIEAENYSFP